MRFYELYVYDKMDNVWDIHCIYTERKNAIRKRNELEEKGYKTKIKYKDVHNR